MNPNVYPLFLKTEGDTVNLLGDIIHLNPKQKYGIGLFNLNGKVVPQKKENIIHYLCCDIVGQAHVGSSKLPCLEIVKPNYKTGFVNSNNTKVMWLSINRHKIPSIRLYLTNEHGELSSLKSCHLDCKLLIVPFDEK
jgi:hypothetical protein